MNVYSVTAKVKQNQFHAIVVMLIAASDLKTAVDIAEATMNYEYPVSAKTNSYVKIESTSLIENIKAVPGTPDVIDMTVIRVKEHL